MTTEELKGHREWAEGCSNAPSHWRGIALCAEVERLQKTVAEAKRVLDLINAEWTSDPQSTQCFDRSIITSVRKVLKDL